MRLLATLRLNPARMRLISGFVDTYLKLNAQELLIFREQTATLAPKEQEQMMELTTSWKEEGIAEGLERGRQQGRQEASRRVVFRLL